MKYDEDGIRKLVLEYKEAILTSLKFAEELADLRKEIKILNIENKLLKEINANRS